MIGIQARKAAAIWFSWEDPYYIDSVVPCKSDTRIFGSAFTGQNKCMKTEIPPTPYDFQLRGKKFPTQLLIKHVCFL